MPNPLVSCHSPRYHRISNFFNRYYSFIMPRPAINLDVPSVSAIEYTLECAEETGVLSTLFSKLLQPDVNEDILQNYCVNISSQLAALSMI